MENLHEIEKLGIEAEQLAAMALAIEDAIAYGPFAEEAYHGAQSLLTELLRQHAKKINRLFDEYEIKPRITG